MTQEEKNIKLAEADGWKLEWRTIRGKRVRRAVKKAPGVVYQRETFFNYFEDLNAVHELWLSLPRVSRILVVANLADMLGLPKGEEDEIGELEEALFSATAAQRAEAIGKTLKLW